MGVLTKRIWVPSVSVWAGEAETTQLGHKEAGREADSLTVIAIFCASVSDERAWELGS